MAYFEIHCISICDIHMMYEKASLFSGSSFPCILFFFFFTFFILFQSGHLGAYDAAMEYEVTKNLLRHKRVDLLDPQFVEADAARGLDGRLYSPHGIGASLTMVPFFLLGEFASRILPQYPESSLHHFSISLMNPLITAFICVILYHILRRLRFDAKEAVLTVCVFGFFTPAFPYSKNSFDVVSTSFLYVLALYTVLRYRQSFHSLGAVLTGVILGYAILTRITTLFLIPIFMFYILVALGEQKTHISRTFKILILFLIPIVAAILLVGWYNILRFGLFYEDGHSTDTAVHLTTPVIVGLFGQLASSGKGLFIYSPVLVFSIFGIRKCYEKYKWETILILGIISVQLLFYSKLVNWSGDWCWGPRFCVLFVPMLCILIGFVDENGIYRRKRFMRCIWIGVLLISLTVQICGVTIDGARRIGNRFKAGDVTSFEIYWNPLKSPVIDHLTLLSQLSIRPAQRDVNEFSDVQSLTFADTTPDFWFVYLYSLGFPLILILGILGLLISCNILCALKIRHCLRIGEKAEC